MVSFVHFNLIQGADGLNLSLVTNKQAAHGMIASLDEVILTTDHTQFAKLDGIMKTVQLGFFAQYKPLDAEFISSGGIGRLVALLRHSYPNVVAVAYQCLT